MDRITGRSQESIPRVWIMDTTLRDGEQAPGVVFGSPARLAVAEALDAIGVDEIEVGVPAMGDAARKDITAIVRRDPRCLLTSWCRAKKEDLELAARCGTGGVHISLPSSSIHLTAMGRDESWVLRTLQDLVAFARKYFDMVSVGAQDATRSTLPFLKTLAETVCTCGADRLRIADTVGIARPSTVGPLIRALRASVPGLSLEFHAHNDLGMATANAVTAVESGADTLSVTVNGLGERAGNAPLEEVAMALFGMGEFQGRIDLSGLVRLSRLVAGASGRDLPPSKPITGPGVFRHESGIHCAGLFKNRRTYEPFEPGMVGQESSEIVIGSHSGTASICHLLAGSGITLDRGVAGRLLEDVRAMAAAQKRAITVDELLERVSAAGYAREIQEQGS